MVLDEEADSLLKYYVYLYKDPMDGQVFYVGKGKGDRFISHLNNKKDTEKARAIQKIRDRGEKPEIWFFSYGLTESQALAVEAAAIEIFRSEKLTNIKSGQNHGNRPIKANELLNYIEKPKRRTSQLHSKDEIITVVKPEEVEIKHKAIMITINQLYRSDMSKEALYEATRGVWNTGTNREKVDYAIALYKGIIKEVYKVNGWYHAGTLKYNTRTKNDVNMEGRWEFDGEIAYDIRDQYIGRYVQKKGQGPFEYKNID